MNPQLIELGPGTEQGRELRETIRSLLRAAGVIRRHRQLLELATPAQRVSRYGFAGATDQEKESRAAAVLAILQAAQSLTDAPEFAALGTID